MQNGAILTWAFLEALCSMLQSRPERMMQYCTCMQISACFNTGPTRDYGDRSPSTVSDAGRKPSYTTIVAYMRLGFLQNG